MRTIIAGVVLVSLFGCASASQKMASKQDYRRAQVEAISVQSNAKGINTAGALTREAGHVERSGRGREGLTRRRRLTWQS
jgi:hypothetical protein